MGSDTNSYGLERIAFFSDGVFAIAATLLALEMQVPVTHEPLRLEQLAKLLPSIAVYVLTFVVIGLFWVLHHRMLAMITRFDYALVFLNMLVLMTVAFLPVPNATFANYASSPLAVVFYASAVSATSLANILFWWYATRRRRYIDSGVSPAAIHVVFRRLETTLVVQMVAIAVAFASTEVAFSLMVFYAATAIVTAILETRPSARPSASP